MDQSEIDDTDDYVPVKDLNGASGGSDVGHHIDAEHVFNQQRAVVAKLSRDEIEDRYLRLLEENVVLKKHACKQEDKIKKLATKLIRVLSEKKRLEMSSGGITAKHRDIETEELIEDQQQKIRDMERQITTLKDKLVVAKQQLVGPVKPQVRKPLKNQTGPSRPMNQGAHHVVPPSPMSMMASPGPLLSQQAQRLLEEARNENRMLEESVSTLKEQINIAEQELEQQGEQHKIKESNYEEEIQILKAQVLDGQRHTADENIQLIQLHKENNMKASQLKTLTVQVESLEEELKKKKSELEVSLRDAKELSAQLQEEQQKNITLSKDISENISCMEALVELREKSKDLQKENSILRESNNKLLDSAYNLERERQYQASENALKVQIAQLESTLKSDLQDKQVLQEALGKEREQYAKLESQFQDVQAKYFAVKEEIEGREAKLKFFAEENKVATHDLEEALILLRHKKDSSSKMSLPSFLEEVEQGDRDLKTDHAQLQVQYVETVTELDKTRSLLRVQGGINQDLKIETEVLQKRLQQVKAEYQGQMSEYKKLLDMRASRIQKLESQLREVTYGNLQKNIGKGENSEGVMFGKEISVHTGGGQSLFEIHVQKALLTKECLIHLGLTEPKIFATWTFYDHEMQYTPMVLGPEAVFDSSSYYKIKLDDSLLDFLSEQEIHVDLHVVVGKDCKNFAYASIKLHEVLDYPCNKLHGSTMLQFTSKSNFLAGTIDYWFKLHTSYAQRILEWQKNKAEIKEMLDKAAASSKALAEVELLKGENAKFLAPKKALDKEKLTSLPDIKDPEIPPRVVQDKPLSIKIQKPLPALQITAKDPPSKIEAEREAARSTERLPDATPKLGKTSPKLMTNAIDETTNSDETSTDSSSSDEVQFPSVAPPTQSESTEPTSKAMDPPESVTEPNEEDFEERLGPEKPTRISPKPLKSRLKSDLKSKDPKPSPNPADKRSSKKKSEKEVVRSPKDSDARLEISVSPSTKDENSKKGEKKPSSNLDTLSNPDSRRKPSPTPSKKSDRVISESKDEDVKKKKECEAKPEKRGFLRRLLSNKFGTKDETDKEKHEEKKAEEESDKTKEPPKPKPRKRNEVKVEEKESSDQEDEKADEEDSEEDEVEEESETDDESEGEEDDDDDNEGADDDDDDDDVEEGTTTISSGHNLQHSSTGAESISQDSEGLVVRRSALNPKDSSASDSDAMVICITKFKASSPNSEFLTDAKIQKLYVEYKFLDLPAEETETPISLPKPAPGESIVFNYRKVVPIDTTFKRRLLSKMLSKDNSESSAISFTLVSEPEEEVGDEGSGEDVSSQCQEIGRAKVDLKEIQTSQMDLHDVVLDVIALESKGNKEIIGSLTVSVIARNVFKTLNLM